MAAVSLRERKKRATAQAIVDAAFGLFAIEGYDAVTVEQIADAADVSPRTVYRYFANKAAIVFDVQVSWMSVFRSAAADSNVAAGEALLARVRAVALAVAAHVQSHAAPALVAYRLTEASAELQSVSLGWEREWRQAVAEMAPHWPRARAIAMAGAVMGMISSVLGLWLETGGRNDLVVMIDRAFEALAAGWPE